MENTNPKNKLCYRCGRFKGYYTKELSHFERAKLGYCKEYEKIVRNLDCCESWQNGYKRLYSGRKTTMKVLSELLTHITAIRQILQESQEESSEYSEKNSL